MTRPLDLFSLQQCAASPKDVPPNMTSAHSTMPDRLRAFRKARGDTIEGLATALGITPVTLIRWEAGRSRPSSSLADKLQTLGFGDLSTSDTKRVSTPRLYLANDQHSTTDLRRVVRNKINLGKVSESFHPSPYVYNGPEDQIAFFERLYSLQQGDPAPIDPQSYKKRLSAVCSIGEPPTVTAQYSLEALKPAAVHWNANYGSHGWHRYVGRFPAQLVRALLNHFRLSDKSVVCDPFAGSGTTLVEARLLGIPALGIEVCPLSCIITRAKSQFDPNPARIFRLLRNYAAFCQDYATTLADATTINEIHARNGVIPRFANDTRWFTPGAYAGVTVAVDFLRNLTGIDRATFACALSASMRSIGNIDVDVVRAEYSKTPRQKVDVPGLVSRKLRKMQRDLEEMALSHKGLIGQARSIRLLEGSLFNADVAKGSIDAVVTSPPYGVESLSYLRTHLLSYRTLHSLLKHDPYEFSSEIVGSEYLSSDVALNVGANSLATSPAMARFFASLGTIPSKYELRVKMMLQFFDDMLRCAESFRRWLKPHGNVAFVIGNKLIDKAMIPTDAIVTELFESRGFKCQGSIKHKLKCNNSNSEVPWQERIIQDEYILLFRKE